jgi:hypothetical protein
MTTITKVQSAQPAGTYTPTKIDEIKQFAGQMDAAKS